VGTELKGHMMSSNIRAATAAATHLMSFIREAN
jgi:hypothetical protein